MTGTITDIERANRQQDRKNIAKEQRKNLKKLIKAMEKHPELPVVAMVDSDIVADDGYCWWLGKFGEVEIDKYISHEDYGVMFYENGKPDLTDIFEKYFDYAECGIDEEMSDKKAFKLMREKVDSLDWIEAIIIHIDLPDIL